MLDVHGITIFHAVLFLSNIFTLSWVGNVYYHFVNVVHLLNSHSDLYHLVFVDIGGTCNTNCNYLHGFLVCCWFVKKQEIKG